MKTAVDTFGSVHVVINNAGTVNPVNFENISLKEFRNTIDVHVYGTFKVCHAAWPIFRKQKFGRIINTSSVEGTYSLAGHPSYSAAKMAIVGLTETLAKEGTKYNITANVVSSLHTSRMTELVIPLEKLKLLDCSYVVPLVANLAHADNKDTWGIYEAGGGYFTKVRWARAQGSLLKSDDSNTPSAILKNWSKVVDFSSPEYPIATTDYMAAMKKSKTLGPAEQGETVPFKDKVVIVTGAGAGFGREYALHLGKQGAKVVVNDFLDPEPVVKEITAAGGIAVGDKSNVVDGEHVVKTAVDSFGTVHAVVNNAGILRDKSFSNLTEQQWKDVINVHLYGTFSVTKAAWPYFLKQKYGRVLTVCSTSGIYGNFGQCNYSAAKTGILGLSYALAAEGAKNNIFVNSIAPTAGTNMTKSIFTEELFESLKPKFVAPLVSLLVSEKCPENGRLFEVGGGLTCSTRLQRAQGVSFTSRVVTAEQVYENWSNITHFDLDTVTYPTTMADGTAPMFAAATADKPVSPFDYSERSDFEYDNRDVCLYNLAIGAPATDLRHSFELDPNFEVLPTFGVIPYFKVKLPLDKMLPNFDPRMLLHAEQYLEVRKFPIPTKAKLQIAMRPLEILDKGKAAVVFSESCAFDKETGDEVFYNVSSAFVRGSGNNGGPRALKGNGPLTATNEPPNRAPDFVGEFRVNDNQAAFYRLCGDYNPLHIDPEFAAVGGFQSPILHGLCTFGISTRLLYEKFGMFKNIKARFTGHVFMGETLLVEAWKEGKRVVFQTRIKERNTFAIKAAALELMDSTGAKL